jgi:hypothetical protein
MYSDALHCAVELSTTGGDYTVGTLKWINKRPGEQHLIDVGMIICHSNWSLGQWETKCSYCTQPVVLEAAYC